MTIEQRRTYQNNYYKKNKGKILKNQKKYYQKNKEKILEKAKEYRGKQKEYALLYYHSNKGNRTCKICNLEYLWKEVNKDGICFLCRREA